jgi:hypothetical protein
MVRPSGWWAFSEMPGDQPSALRGTTSTISSFSAHADATKMKTIAMI